MLSQRHIAGKEGVRGEGERGEGERKGERGRERESLLCFISWFSFSFLQGFQQIKQTTSNFPRSLSFRPISLLLSLSLTPPSRSCNRPAIDISPTVPPFTSPHLLEKNY